MTLESDITWRGQLDFAIQGEGVTLINRGVMLAEHSKHLGPSTRDGSNILIDGNRALVDAGNFFVNEGTIEVRASDRAAISGTETFINRGSLRVTDGSYLRMTSRFVSPKTVCDPGSYVALGGAVITESGSVSELSRGGLWLTHGCEFRGGTVRMTDGATLEGTPAFNNVVFEGELHWFNPNSRFTGLPPYLPNYGAVISVNGNLTLNGLIAFHPKPGEFSASLNFGARGAVLLDGKGRILLEKGASPSFVGGLGQDITIGQDITVEAHNAILGTGFIGSRPIIRNLGTILADQPGDSLQVTATLMTNGGVMRIGSNVVVNFYRDFTQTATGSLVFLAAGTEPGVSHGQFKIGAAANLDGTLALEPVAPFQPVLGNSFRVLEYATRQGTLGSLRTPPAPVGSVWKADYLDTGLELRVTTP